MISYIARRLLLMIPTLFGITVMVFLIARLAPGRPGQMELGRGEMSAEAAKAQAEWFEERYGYGDPIYQQYINWWKGMFSKKVLAQAYLAGEELRPIFTWRKDTEEYYIALEHGSWLAFSELDPIGNDLVQDDEQLTSQLSTELRESLIPIEAGYAKPRHRIINPPSADSGGDSPMYEIGSLDEVSDLLKPATILVEGEVEALTWNADDGYPLYINTENPDEPIFQRNDEWFKLTPSTPRSAWRALTIDDSQVQSVLSAYLDELPESSDDYAIPRHMLVAGDVSKFEGTVPASPKRLTVATTADIPTRLWIASNENNKFLTPVFEQADPIPQFLMKNDDGSFSRITGETLISPPDYEVLTQDDETFSNQLAPAQKEALPTVEEGETTPRVAIVDAEMRPLGFQPPARNIREYQYETRIFEVTLGKSNTSKKTVVQELRDRLPVTLMLSLVAFPLIYAIAIPTGMLMAVKRGKYFDAGSNALMLAAWSIPTVLSATLFIGYATQGGEGVEWFPNGRLSSVGSSTWPFFEWLGDRVWHLILPVFCMVYVGVAYLAKQMRAAVLDNFTMDYVRTARAKGVTRRDILFRHVLRNSLLPIITIFATILPALIAGSIIIEKIFNIEGMGLLAFRAVTNRDYDVVQAIALIAGALNLTGLLIADICYAIADPRITYK